MKGLKILYLYLYESYGYKTHFLLGLLRISNYLNSRKGELNGEIEEEYLDLRHEALPRFTPQNLEIYRKELKNVLKDYYESFPFDLVAISCYTSFMYLNCVEVANMIKKDIAPDCMIVVGGVHPTICPEDFQIGNFPDFIYEEYSIETTPFDYLIKDEGEVPFFNLIQKILRDAETEDIEHQLEIIDPTILQDLNDLPLININLFKKYKTIINKNEKYSYFSIDFSRGCPFRCKFCYNSGDLIDSCKNVRIRSIDKCIDDLMVLKNSSWLKINELFVSDMIFLPKRSKRSEFFKKLDALSIENNGFPFIFNTMNRIELCTSEDLENYKKYNFIPHFGLESCSTTLLTRMGKFLGNDKETIIKNAKRQLQRFVEIVKRSNLLELPVVFFYIIGLPGSDIVSFEEGRDFLFRKGIDGLSLIKKYRINFLYNKYVIYKNTNYYETCEEEYGSKIYEKEWWRKFDEYCQFYPAMVEPSITFSLIDSMSKNLMLFRKIFKIQQRLGNPYYISQRLDSSSKNAAQMLDLLRKTGETNTKTKNS